MYGQEIARVHAHDNGYTVETRTKPSKGKGPNFVGGGDSDPVPGFDWESSVASSKKDILDRVAAAHATHQDAKMRNQYRKLSGAK